MKVFISWSGAVSKQVALALRDWLPLVIHSVEPYMSEKDIASGVRWGTDVAGELEAASFGILCLTPSNTDAPWLNFEAGALSKSLEESRVVPFLYRLEPTDISRKNPLVQFQAVRADEEGALKLITDLNASCEDHPLDEQRLQTMFELSWTRLEAALNAIKTGKGETDELPERTEQDILTELLDLVRTQQKILSDPRALLPPEYVGQVLGPGARLEGFDPVLIDVLVHRHQFLRHAIRTNEDIPPGVGRAVDEMGDLLRMLRAETRVRHGRPRRSREVLERSDVRESPGDESGGSPEAAGEE